MFFVNKLNQAREGGGWYLFVATKANDGNRQSHNHNDLF